MAKTKSQKQKIIEDLREKIQRQKAIVFVEISGLKAKEFFDLRKKLKKKNSQTSVVKKTLFKIALEELSKNLAEKLEELKGQVATIFGFGDEIMPAKIAYEFSLENKNLKILGGYLEKKFRGVEEIINLAQIPPEEELLGKLVGSFSAPILNFLNILEANLKGLIFVLSKIKK